MQNFEYQKKNSKYSKNIFSQVFELNLINERIFTDFF